MTKTYTLESENADENVRVKITETKEVTTDTYVSISELKQRHAQLLGEIERTKIEADLIVDQIKGVQANTDITVTAVPVKLTATAVK